MGSRARALLFFSVFAALCAGCGGPSESPDGGSVDAASPQDGGSCTTDVTCDDGLFCNGLERCDEGQCVRGSAPDCADAIDCTRDACSEGLRQCVHAVPDMDLDGHGTITCVGEDGVPLGDDCDDEDETTFPGATEICDELMHDEDCDTATFGAVDADSDGFEAIRCCNGDACGTDCNDGARGANPEATEVCNGIDDDCNSRIDEGVGVDGFADEDRDGWGDAAHPMTSCGDAIGFSTRPGDCDDDSIEVNPGLPELCDTVDNDCDLAVDEDVVDVTWYVDGDGDGYGSSSAATMVSCMRPTGHSILGTDCDDTTSSRSPRVAEMCNGIDDDCNGRADYAIAAGDLEDDDGDGVADRGCGAPRGLDCDDYSATRRPSAPEVCNGQDDDCDGTTDESATSTIFHRDADGDGYGDRGSSAVGCFAPGGFVLDGTDCDDRSATRHPNAAEACDAIDGDCDGRIDETPAELSCSIDHATASCTVGVCHFDACASGYADCTSAPGCETNTRSDPDHCGSCAPCSGGGSCVLGTCLPGGVVAGVTAATGDDAVTAVASADDGSLAVLGSYAGSFVGGCGDLPAGSGDEAFVERHQFDGTCVYLVGVSGSGDEKITSAVLDAAGNLYVALATTSATVTISTGGTIPLGAGQGGEDMVVFSLDPAGALRWSQRIGGTGDDHANAVVVGGTNVFLVGGLIGPATLSPTISIPMHDGSRNPFLAQLDASTGSIVAARVPTPMGTAADDEALDVDVDETGSSVVVAGVVAGALSFGSGMTVTPEGATDGFVWHASATTLTSVSTRVISGGGPDRATAIAVDGSRVFVGGTFVGNTSYSGISLEAHGASDRDGFIITFDLASGDMLGMTGVGGPSPDSIDGIDADSNFVAAVGTAGPGYTNLGGYFTEGSGGTDGFGLVLDPFMGLAITGYVFQGSSDSSGYAVSACDSSFRFGGTYQGTVRVNGTMLPDAAAGADGVWFIADWFPK